MRHALRVSRSDSGLLDTTAATSQVPAVDFDEMPGRKTRLLVVAGWQPYTALYAVDTGWSVRLYLVQDPSPSKAPAIPLAAS